MRCDQPGCKKQHTSYGKVDGKAKVCAEHAKGDMAFVRNELWAQWVPQGTIAYGRVGGKAEHCAEHAGAGMIEPVMCAVTRGCTKQPLYAKADGTRGLCAERAKSSVLNSPRTEFGQCPHQEVWPRRLP